VTFCSLGAANMTGLSRFVSLLSESVSRIPCESNDDILSNDYECTGDKDYAQSKQVEVSNYE
jgi:hypothetical protein